MPTPATAGALRIAPPLPAEVLYPTIRLYGTVNEYMLVRFLEGIDPFLRQGGGSLGIELFTGGGEAETGRRINLEIRLAREKGIDLYFIGKTMVYSAGVTIMAAFPPERRYLSRDCALLVHGRNTERTVHLSGPIKASLQHVRTVLHEFEMGLELERKGFAELIDGSRVTMEELSEKAEGNWYLMAKEAVDRGLVAGLI